MAGNQRHAPYVYPPWNAALATKIIFKAQASGGNLGLTQVAHASLCGCLANANNPLTRRPIFREGWQRPQHWWYPLSSLSLSLSRCSRLTILCSTGRHDRRWNNLGGNRMRFKRFKYSGSNLGLCCRRQLVVR